MSLDNLPVEWFETTFENVIFSISNGVGGKQNKESVGIPVTRIETIAQAKIDFEKIGFIPEPDKKDVEKYRLNKGDILFSHINSPVHLGKTAIFQHDAVLYHGINLLRIVVDNRIINYKFFNYFCNLIRSEGIFSLNAQHAVNQSSINQKKLNSFKINLAPLAEQQEIVRQLDLMLAQVEQIKARLDAIPAILKKFRQSVLADAVRGKLIEQDFTQLPLESFSKYLTDVRYGTSKKCSESLINAVPVLRIPNIADDGTLDFTNLKYAEFESKEIKQLQLSKGDLLLIRSNGSLDLVGKSAIADELDRVVLYAGYLIRLRFNDYVNPQFIQYFLKAPQTRQIIENIARSTSGVNNINSKEIASLKIHLPSFDIQNEIILRVKQLLTLSNRIEKTVQSAQKRVNLLTQSILAKAFSGELTAEWREQHQDLITGINSAESLLAKIQAEREASKPVKKTRAKKEV